MNTDNLNKGPDKNTILKIKKLQTTIKSVSEEMIESAKQVEDVLLKQNSELKDLRTSIHMYTKRYEKERSLLDKEIQSTKIYKDLIENRKKFMKNALLPDDNITLERNFKEKLIKQQDNKQKISSVVANLLQDLEKVFDIKKNDKGFYLIRNIYLPDSRFQSSENIELISCALGMVAHAVELIAKYYGVFLKYPIVLMSSRSTIQDPISSNQENHSYPLYIKGVEKARFDYAVYLLNKNISQVFSSFLILVTRLSLNKNRRSEENFGKCVFVV